MKFARRVFLVAGVYGLIVLLPQYFMEGRIAADNPPPITHPEYFYGFIGLGLAWQILFLLVARDPSRYRFVMLPATLEKLAFGGAALILDFQHRLALQVFAFGLVDLVFAALFIVAFTVTQERTSEAVIRGSGHVNMDDLRKKAITSLVRFQIVMALLLFLPAWSWRFWEGWVYWMLFSVSALLGTLSLLKRDPGLVESRLKAGPGAEREKSQKIMQMLAGIFACGLIVVPGIERRFHALIIPSPLVLVADALVVMGYLIVFLVLRENSYASSIVEVKAGQRVISPLLRESQCYIFACILHFCAV